MMNFDKRNLSILTGLLLSVIFGGLSVYKLSFGTGWGDEFFFVSGAINNAIDGQFSCGVYNALSMWALIPWVKIFGTSRPAVCSFDVLWAVASCIAIVVVCVKRTVFKDWKQVLVFCALFWGGHNLTQTMLCGRPDTMVMFFTVLSLAFLLSESGMEPRTNILLFSSVFLLAMTAIGSLPIVAVAGLVLFVCPKSLPRPVVFWRGFWCVAAIVAALICMCGYFLLHGHMFEYVYNLFIAHSSLVSGQLEGSSSQFPACYLSELSALILAISSMVFCLLPRVRQSVDWRWVIFPIAVPAIMVGAGHYAYYYHWMFYVPAAVLAAAVVVYLPKRAAMFAVAVGVFALGYTQLEWFKRFGNREFLAQQQRFLALLDRNAQAFRRGDQLIVSHRTFYYPGVSRGLKTKSWANKTIDIFLRQRSRGERINKAVGSLIRDAGTRTRLMSVLNRVESPGGEIMPGSGLFFVHTHGEEAEYLSVYRKLGYRVELIDRDNEYALYGFSNGVEK